MKRFIFACAVFLLPAVSVLGQETPPADTASAVTPSQTTPSADTGNVPVPPPESAPADTGSTSPADTAALPAAPPDTGTVLQPPTTPPTDTGGAATPRDTAAAPPTPADTGAAVPPPTIPSVDTALTAPAPATPPIQTLTPQAEEGGEPPASKPPKRVGLGIVFNDEAPLSLRAWFNPKVGVDVGLGLAVRTVEDLRAAVPSPESTTTFLDLSFDLGIPVRALRHEKLDFILRPGFGFRTRPVFDQTAGEISVETGLELELNGSAGFEYYPFENASFGLFTGIALIADRPGGSGNTILRLESLPSKKGVNFTFRYYAF